jgi:hypothetical protein
VLAYFSFFFLFFFDTFCIAQKVSKNARRKKASARRPDARPAFSSGLRLPSFCVISVGWGESLGIFLLLFVWSVLALCLLFPALVVCFSAATPTSIGVFFLFFFDTFCIAHGCWSGDATTGKYPKTLEVTCWFGDATRENASARRPHARPAFSSALRSPSFGVSGVGWSESFGIFCFVNVAY